MDRAFVERIERPERLALQDLQAEATDVVRERLAAYDMAGVPDWVVRKLTYTYYHDWETDSPTFVFLLEDPGTPGEHVLMEVNEYLELGEGYDVHDAIQIDRRFGTRWLATRRYTPFSSEFIEICRDHGLLSTDREWWQYLLSMEFFDDFYMADVIKYRGTNPSTGTMKIAFSTHLIHELEYVDPDLVFAFGKQAWETLLTQLGAEPTGNPPPGSGVNDVHGRLHTATRLLETDVLPLGHPSTNFRGAQISHEDYMRRLEQGIADWTATT